MEDESEYVRDEKKELLQLLTRLTPEGLGEVVDLIQRKAPEAVEGDEEEYQIIIPAIEDWLWQ